MIKNIIFDLGGVIIRLNDVSEPIRRFKAIGLADADQQLGVYGHKGIFKELESGVLDAEGFQQKLAEMSGRESVSYDEAYHAWMGYMKDIPTERLDYMLELRKDYKLFLLSNLSPYFGDFVKSTRFDGRGNSIDHYLDKAFYSYELKDYKPSPSIFMKVLDNAGLTAAECLFVDDSPHNVAAAEAVGMQAMLVPAGEDWRGLLKARLEDDK